MAAKARLFDLRIPQIWAKAISRSHGTILARIGANHVIYPEAEAGERVAHRVSGRVLDFIEFDDDFAIVKMYLTRPIRGIPLSESQVRKKCGVTVVGVKAPGKDFTYATADTVVSDHDLIIVSGKSADIEKFATLFSWWSVPGHGELHGGGIECCCSLRALPPHPQTQQTLATSIEGVRQ